MQACDAGKNRATVGATQISQCLECVAGKYSANSSAVCVDCEAGKFSADNAGSCGSCTANSNSPTSSTVDTACICNAGYYGSGNTTCQVWFPPYY